MDKIFISGSSDVLFRNFLDSPILSQTLTERARGGSLLSDSRPGLHFRLILLMPLHRYSSSTGSSMQVQS